MKQPYLILLICLLWHESPAQSTRPPLVFESQLRTHGDVTLQASANDGEKGLGKALSENSKYLTQWEGETGIRLLTLKDGIGQAIPPLVLNVPPQYQTRFEITKGTTRLHQLKGQVEGHSQGGDMYLQQVTAQVRLHAQGGSIYAENSDLQGDLIAPAGDIELNDVGGNFSALSPRGQVRARFSERFFRSMDKPFSFGVSKGSLTAIGARAGVLFALAQGNITLQKSQGQAIATVSEAGDIRMEGVSGQVRARTEKGSVWVELLPEAVKGEQPIEIESRAGDVTLIVPKDLQGLLVIESIQTQATERKPLIESAIDLGKADWQEQRNEKGEVTGRRFQAVQPMGEGKKKEDMRLIRLRVRNGNLTIKTY